MDYSEVNWEMAENLAATFFQDEYEAITRQQIKDLEERISKGQHFVVSKQEVGGMHHDMGATLDYMDMILTAVSLVLTWHNTWNSKSGKEYKDFLNYLKNNPQDMQFFIDVIERGVNQTIKKEFENIIAKLEESRK